MDGDLPWIRGDRGGEGRCGGCWFGSRLLGWRRDGNSAEAVRGRDGGCAVRICGGCSRCAESRGAGASWLRIPSGRIRGHGIERVARHLKFRCGWRSGGDGNRSKRAGPRSDGVGDGWGGAQGRGKDGGGRRGDGGRSRKRGLMGRRLASYRQFRRGGQIRGGQIWGGPGRGQVCRQCGRARRHQRQRRRLRHSDRGGGNGYGRGHVQLHRHVPRGVRLQRGAHL